MPSSAGPPVGKLGDTLALEGLPGSLDTTGTVRADFTLKRYVDHAQAAVDYFKAPPGKRLVATEFTIAGTGQGTYAGSHLAAGPIPPRSPAAPGAASRPGWAMSRSGSSPWT